jgi:hypothetical protein
MRISKELAHAMAEGRKKFLCVYQSRAIVLCPYQGEGCVYVSTHYVPELKRSILCEGEGNCRYHDLKEVAKLHVAAQVLRKALPYAEREGKRIPKNVPWDPVGWTDKIVELTENCFAQFEAGRPEGTLATISRAPGRTNGKVEFHWLDSKLVNVPDTPLSVEQLLPVVIRGSFYNKVETASLDKSADGRTKHKI